MTTVPPASSAPGPASSNRVVDRAVAAIEAIIATEDRQVFSERLQAIQESLAVSRSAHTIEEALQVAQEIKYPVLVRAGKPLLLRYSSYKLLLLQFCKLFYSYVTYFPVTRSLCSGRTGFRLR